MPDHPIDSIIAERWSARAIDAARPVEHEKVLTMLEAARWAPSCFGDEPWRFLLWQRDVDADAWEQAMSTLAEKNQLWARNAPVLILSLAASQFSRNQKPNRWGQYDTGAATENLHLQGVALGLVVHQMGGFDVDAAREAFAIPAEYDLMAMIAIGYPAPVESLPEEFRGGETAERARNAMNDWVHVGRWGNPLT